MTPVDNLRSALKQAAGRDNSVESSMVLEHMLDDGMLQYGEKTQVWMADGTEAPLEQIYGMHSEMESIILELFVERKLVLQTNRDGKIGIYYLAAANAHACA